MKNEYTYYSVVFNNQFSNFLCKKYAGLFLKRAKDRGSNPFQKILEGKLPMEDLLKKKWFMYDVDSFVEKNPEMSTHIFKIYTYVLNPDSIDYRPIEKYRDYILSKIL
jgi:hypothetical protein